MLSLLGYWTFNHAEICSGDQSRISLLATIVAASRRWQEGTPWVAEPTPCIVPAFDGAYFSEREKEALWDRFFTGAPARLLVVQIERDHAALADTAAVVFEVDFDYILSGRDRGGGSNLVTRLPEPVVLIDRLAVFEVEREPGDRSAFRYDDTVGTPVLGRSMVAVMV